MDYIKSLLIRVFTSYTYPFTKNQMKVYYKQKYKTHIQNLNELRETKLQEPAPLKWVRFPGIYWDCCARWEGQCWTISGLFSLSNRLKELFDAGTYDLIKHAS